MRPRASRAVQRLFFLAVVRPLVSIVIGLNVRHRERLPARGPAIIVANHNSHLDTVVLMTLFSPRVLAQLRPVAAADYFLRNQALAWFARTVINIIPIERHAAGRSDPLAAISEALTAGEIVIIFPEGSRGEPEHVGRFKSGVGHLARRHPDVPVCPIFMHGLGKALPKGSFLLVPFFCDVFVGECLHGLPDHRAFMDQLAERMHALESEGHFAPWE
jgi:1-acyl-sn-glycerol-3-phosphate acyltransferase